MGMAEIDERILMKVAAVQKGIAGIRNAYHHANAPNAFRRNQLPCFINVYGPGETVERTMGQATYIEERIVFMTLYLSSIESPSDLAMRQAKLLPFIRLTRAEFQTNLLLDEEITEIKSAFILSDDGIEPLGYAGVVYAGVQFQLGLVIQV
jgi:hypothetical protein